MRPIIAVMLSVDVAVFLVVSFAVVIRKFSPDRPHPLLRSLAIPLLIAGMGSTRIGDSHPSAVGVELLQSAGLLLMGMAIMSILFALRKRRGLDTF